MTPTPKQITALVNASGLTRKQVAELMGVTETSVYSWMSGKHKMNHRDWAYLRREVKK
jgi:transcriptional regulator with XRE-family HTH domain